MINFEVYKTFFELAYVQANYIGWSKATKMVVET